MLTNPDLPHAGLLRHREWGDVLHRSTRWSTSRTSPGACSGSHVALVLRRLLRLCERYDAHPRVLLASATIGNPAQHAATLVGRDVAAVEVDGSPTGARHVGLWRPPLVDSDRRDGKRVSSLREIGELLAGFVAAGTRTIAFVRSRRAAEVVATVAREGSAPTTPCTTGSRRTGPATSPPSAASSSSGCATATCSAWRPPRRSSSGSTSAASTRCCSPGGPGTTAAYHQRLGRAGRGADASAGVLVAGEDLLDQWLVTHPDQLAERRPETRCSTPPTPCSARLRARRSRRA